QNSAPQDGAPRGKTMTITRSRLSRWPFIAYVSLACCLSAGAGCTSHGDVNMDEPAATARSALEADSTLNTFINKSIQVDQLNAPQAPNDPSDANLFLGPDPADGTASRDFPTGGPLPFIDWHDLGGDLANHRVLDLDATTGPNAGKDVTSFPGSNECVGPSKV